HEHIGAIRTKTDAADVHQMRGAGEQADQSVLVKAGRGDDKIVEVAGAHPGVVGDVGITRGHVFQAEVTNEMLDRFGELTWPGVPGPACASIRPWLSKMPAERSPASRTIAEKAVRSKVCACSSTTAIRRFHMICSSMSLGSLRIAWSSVELRPRRQYQRATGIDADIEARRNIGRGAVL